MLKRFVVASVLLALTVTAGFAVGGPVARAQDSGSNNSIACDSTLMILLYIAQRDYNYSSANLDLVSLDRGQFTPLFDNLSTMESGTTDAQGQTGTGDQAGQTGTGNDTGAAGQTGAGNNDIGAAGETSTGAGDQGAAGQTGTGNIQPPASDSGVTMLVPGSVAGEDPVCAQLREELTSFFYDKLYSGNTQDLMGQQGASDQGAAGQTGTGNDTGAAGQTGTGNDTGAAGQTGTGNNDTGAAGQTGTGNNDTGAAAGQTGSMVSCDSTLMILLYVAERDYGFESANVDVAQFDYGQFSPLFDNLDLTSNQTDQTNQGTEGTTDQVVSPDPNFTMLQPGNIEGENASCMQLRQELVDFYFQRLSLDNETQDQIGMQDQADQQGTVGTDQQSTGAGSDTSPSGETTTDQQITGTGNDTGASIQTGTDQSGTGGSDQGSTGMTGTDQQGTTSVQTGTDQQGTAANTSTDQQGQTQTTAGASDCVALAGGTSRINVRSGPGLNFGVSRQLNPGEQLIAVGQMTDAQGSIWLSTSEGLWVRQDVISAQGNCQALPAAQFTQDTAGQQAQAGQTQTQQSQFSIQQPAISSGTWAELRITNDSPLVYVPASCVQDLPSFGSVTWQGSRASSIDFARQNQTPAQQQQAQQQIEQVIGVQNQPIGQFDFGQQFLVSLVCNTPAYDAPGGAALGVNLAAGQTWYASPYLWFGPLNAAQAAQ